MVTISRLV